MPLRAHVNLIGFLEGIDEKDLPADPAEFWRLVAWELTQCIMHATNAVDPHIVFDKYHQAGEQYIWNFYVNDLKRPQAEEHNVHGQNTSQWLYAGCVLLQGGRVSTHH